MGLRMDNLDQIKLIAIAVRRILETNKHVTPDCAFKNFPIGCCGPTAELLARYFSEIVGFDANYISGRRADSDTHAWISIGDVIVDITADQFGQSPVLVCQKSDWHETWHVEPPRKPITSQKQWPLYPFSTWHFIKERINLNNLKGC